MEAVRIKVFLCGRDQEADVDDWFAVDVRVGQAEIRFLKIVLNLAMARSEDGLLIRQLCKEYDKWEKIEQMGNRNLTYEAHEFKKQKKGRK